MMGPPAQLGVGPDAANLNGALVASALIADALRLEPGPRPASGPKGGRLRAAFEESHGNRYSLLDDAGPGAGCG
jgi:hypothetical protein